MRLLCWLRCGQFGSGLRWRLQIDARRDRFIEHRHLFRLLHGRLCVSDWQHDRTLALNLAREALRVLEHRQQLVEGLHGQRHIRRQPGIGGMGDLVDVDPDPAQLFESLRIRESQASRQRHDRSRQCVLTRRCRLRLTRQRRIERHDDESAQGRSGIDRRLLQRFALIKRHARRHGHCARCRLRFLYTRCHCLVLVSAGWSEALGLGMFTENGN